MTRGGGTVMRTDIDLTERKVMSEKSIAETEITEKNTTETERKEGIIVEKTENEVTETLTAVTERKETEAIEMLSPAEKCQPILSPMPEI